jgi:glycosyltransferase involved in cell wall biosynthesis
VIPSKIFELMGMCRPILSTVDGETRRILEKAGSGAYVEAENPEAMAREIRALKSDPDRMKTMSEAGRVYVTEHFSRDILAARCLRVLRGVVED